MKEEKGSERRGEDSPAQAARERSQAGVVAGVGSLEHGVGQGHGNALLPEHNTLTAGNLPGLFIYLFIYFSSTCRHGIILFCPVKPGPTGCVPTSSQNSVKNHLQVPSSHLSQPFTPIAGSWGSSSGTPLGISSLPGELRGFPRWQGQPGLGTAAPRPTIPPPALLSGPLCVFPTGGAKAEGGRELAREVPAAERRR